MSPVIQELKRHPKKFNTIIVATAQHREMLDQALSLFHIKPDVDLNIMNSHQTLHSLTCCVLEGMETTLNEQKPDIILVQGDTTTVFVSTLAAFYKKIPVAHIEAGLRSHNIYSPFPEEVNRRLTTVMAEIHFAPTPFAKRALLNEGIASDNIIITGNTVVDALMHISQIPFSFKQTQLKDVNLDDHRILLVTSHRRESWGIGLRNICEAIKDIVQKHSDIIVIYPIHPNPEVKNTVEKILFGQERIYLIDPLDYFAFINLIKKAYLILTDSGGLQEEAPTFKKPLLVLRDVTERPEALHAGLSKVIGTARDRIVEEADYLLNDVQAYQKMIDCKNPYGDGYAAKRIVKALSRWSEGKKPLISSSEEFDLQAEC